MSGLAAIVGDGRGRRFLPLIVGLASIAIILIAVKGASVIVSQFLMAFVITVAVAPIQSWLIKRGMKPVFAFLITVIVVVVGLALLMLALTASLSRFIGDLPQYEEEFAQLQGQIQELLAPLGISQDTVAASASANSSSLVQGVASAASWLIGGFTNFGFMLALAAFMLFEATQLPAKWEQIASPSRRAPVERFVGDVRSYIVVTTWVNFLVGLIDTVLLFILGVPYAVLWGVLAFLFGFIPSIGFLLSLVGPALMAFLVSGPTAALIVIVAFILINGGIQNIVMPRMMGEGTDLSPAVVFGSLLFWGFVLGPIGAILSVPMTMIVRLALSSSEDTAGLGYLMSAGAYPYNPDLFADDAGDAGAQGEGAPEGARDQPPDE